MLLNNYFLVFDIAKSTLNPVVIPSITRATGPPIADMSNVETIANAAKRPPIIPPASFLKENLSMDSWSAPLATFSPAPANVAITSSIGMSAMTVTTSYLYINFPNL